VRLAREKKLPSSRKTIVSSDMRALSDTAIFANSRTVKRVGKKTSTDVNSNEPKVSHNERVARRMRERCNLDWRFG